MKLDTKRMFLILAVMVVGMAINRGLSTSNSLGETVFFAVYGLTWAIWASTCWVFLDELEEENWRRAHGV